jgi:hypothetical protein
LRAGEREGANEKQAICDLALILGCPLTQEDKISEAKTKKVKKKVEQKFFKIPTHHWILFSPKVMLQNKVLFQRIFTPSLKRNKVQLTSSKYLNDP